MEIMHGIANPTSSFDSFSYPSGLSCSFTVFAFLSLTFIASSRCSYINAAVSLSVIVPFIRSAASPLGTSTNSSIT